MFFDCSESDFFLQFGSNFYEISHVGPGPFNLDLGSGMVKMRSPWRQIFNSVDLVNGGSPLALTII